MVAQEEPKPLVYLKSMPQSLSKLLGEKPLITPVPILSVPEHTIAEKRALLRDGMVVVIDSMHAVLDGGNKYPRGIEKIAWQKQLTDAQVEWYYGEQCRIDGHRAHHTSETYLTWSGDALLAYCCATLRRVGIHSPTLTKVQCMMVPGMTCWEVIEVILSKLEPYCT